MTGVDITEVILADHHEQRRMFAMLDEVDRADTATLGALWTRLSAMLEVHAQAEEMFFYPELLSWASGGTRTRRSRRPRTRSATTTTSGTGSSRRAGTRSAPTAGGAASSPPARPTTSTWARRSTRASPTSAGTSTSTPVTDRGPLRRLRGRQRHRRPHRGQGPRRLHQGQLLASVCIVTEASCQARRRRSLVLVQVSPASVRMRSGAAARRVRRTWAAEVASSSSRSARACLRCLGVIAAIMCGWMIGMCSAMRSGRGSSRCCRR